MYDSLRKGLCAASPKALASIMLSPLPFLTLKIMNVQSQPNSTDCGPFAAAYVTELCYGRKPIDINFCVPRMRDHMKKCFLRRRMTPFDFPSEIRRAVRCTEIRRVSLPLVCICRRPRLRDDDITACNCCCQYFHVGLKSKGACVTIKSRGDMCKWICPLCLG